MSKRRSVPTDSLIAALKASAGIVSTAAKKAGVDETTLRRRIKKEPKLAAAYEAITESNLDLAESGLMALIKKRHPAALIFYLKTKGKHRGYVEKQEIETTTGEPVRLYVPKMDEPVPAKEYVEPPTVDDRSLVEPPKRTEDDDKKA